MNNDPSERLKEFTKKIIKQIEKIKRGEQNYQSLDSLLKQSNTKDNAEEKDNNQETVINESDDSKNESETEDKESTED